MAIINTKIELAFLVTLLLVFSVASSSLNVFAVDNSETEARTAIENAENSIINCYEAAVEAGKSGADIAPFLSVLNEAGIILSKATLAYDHGNFTLAIFYANQTQTELDGFVSWVKSAEETAVQQGHLDFLLNVVGSIGGSIGVVCGGFAVWFVLNKRYKKLDVQQSETSGI